MVTIRTRNFILRPFRMSDAKGIAEAINNKIIAKNTLTIPYPYTLRDAKKWLKESSIKNRAIKDVDFCIEIDGEVAGSVGFHRISKRHKAELGYWLAEKYWGKGIMTKVVKVATDYGFNKLKLKRIFAFTHSFNKASMSVLEKNGYKFEGMLKKNIRKGNKYFDSNLFAKTR